MTVQVAVVGGGIFGITTALEVTRQVPDVSVTLFEKEHDVLQAASGTNQWRLHRGYHYPRSRSTAVHCRDSHDRFLERFGRAVIAEHDHYYCIASERTRTSPEEFRAHCDALGLETRETSLDIVNGDAVDACLRVEENHIDPIALRAVLWERLDRRGVEVRLNHRVESTTTLDDEYDYTVVAAYAGTNGLLEGFPSLQQEFKFQLIEKPVVTLPPAFHNRSVVVMDGPFMSFDPYGRTAQYQLDHVVHGVRAEHVGMTPKFPEFDATLLDEGVVVDPPATAFPEFVESYDEFFDGVDEADHLGSRFTVRTVLPDVDDTDARPTLVDRSSDVFRVFSGKIGTCVNAAEQIADAVASETS